LVSFPKVEYFFLTYLSL